MKKLLAMVLMFALGGCSHTESPTDPDGGTIPGEPPADGEKPPLKPVSDDPRTACDDMLSCLGRVQPTGVHEATAAYGEGGSCFKGFSAEECGNQCRQALMGLHKLRADDPMCSYCEGDSDCLGSRVCEPSLKRCVACREQLDCSRHTQGQICLEDEFRCVECRTNQDCERLYEDWQVCDPETNRCVDCSKDQDCEAKSEGELHACGPNKLNPDFNTCQACRVDDHCPAERPACHALECVECNTGEDCPTDPGLDYYCEFHVCKLCTDPPCADRENG